MKSREEKIVKDCTQLMSNIFILKGTNSEKIENHDKKREQYKKEISKIFFTVGPLLLASLPI